VKTTFAVIGTLLVLILLPWLFMGNEYFLYKFFAPKKEQVRREVFEQTKSYQEGMIQELQNMQFEYVKADDAHKDALASIILHRAADFPEDQMPEDLRNFIKKLRDERMNPTSTTSSSKGY
jgi:hypothetical protein